ncbi:MAG TPA: protein translocase subunit SecD [Candidatus Woesebacteria bacterium]|nr:protein translocase subunit SecD [Candidatus Woesebacteria bacterium]
MIFRIVKIVMVALALGGLIWINLPSRIPLQFTLGDIAVDTSIGSPVLSWQDGSGQQFTKKFETKFGLDLQGGSHFVFEADTSKLNASDVEDAISSTRNIIERRVNLFGVAEPSIQVLRSGQTYRISVDLPGVKDHQEAINLIGQTAQLVFKEEGELDPSIPISIATQSAIFRLTKDTGLTGKDVRKAQVTFNSENAEPSVQLSFNDEGASKFADITKRNVGKLVGIFLDADLLTAPVVQTEILDGTAIITGQFTVESAKSLAVSINSGALPVPIQLVQSETVGPSLGARDVSLSLFAGVVGLVCVILFMIIYYGRLGLIASVGLLLYGLITHGLFRAIPVVLTLPGIAGFILSIGMAVDSNILIFERIKEELRLGKPHQTAVRIGFGKAMDAIKDANVTTLIVAFILFNPLNWEFLPQFGLVKGFALTLAIGVITSLFTGVFITRRLLKVFYTRS